MSFLSDELVKRQLPELMHTAGGHDVRTAEQWELRSAEIIRLLTEKMYGSSPPPVPVKAEVTAFSSSALAGKARMQTVQLRLSAENGVFTFPLRLVLPRERGKHPFVLFIAFRPDIPDIFFPAEEIIDHGYAAALFCCSDVTYDRDDSMRQGLPAIFDRRKYTWGKQAVWAYAASRALDYLLTLNELDPEYAAVCGQSRMAKAALWCAACDKRVKYVYANNSGCGGAALTRGKSGETIENLVSRFGYWFTEDFRNYSPDPYSIPFDMHFLLASIAPRVVCIGAAEDDTWADTNSMFLSCVAASPAFELLGVPGLISHDKYPRPGESFTAGHIRFHLRTGEHFLSRYDWNQFLSK